MKVRSILVRLVATATAIGLSVLLLASIFEELDWSVIASSLRSLTDAERLALISGAGLVIAAQGLITSSTVTGLPVRRGVQAFLGPASVASVIPGPSDLPIRYRMLISWGYSPAECGLAVTASGIFSVGTKLVMPILAAVVALTAGIAIDDGSTGTILLAGVVLAALIAGTAVVLGSARLTSWLAYWFQAPWEVAARLLKRQSSPLSSSLEGARTRAVDLLKDRWVIATWAVFLHTCAQIGLMLMAIRFMGVPSDAIGATEVFIAFGVIQGLTVLPITAGNAGISEAGWIALLGAMAGAGLINEITAAVIIFRILTWLVIIPLGAAALLIWRQSIKRSAREPALDRSQPPAEASA